MDAVLPFITAIVAAQKDRAVRMLARPLRFKHEVGGEVVYADSVTFDGLLTIRGASARVTYAPDLLEVAR